MNTEIREIPRSKRINENVMERKFILLDSGHSFENRILRIIPKKLTKGLNDNGIMAMKGKQNFVKLCFCRHQGSMEEPLKYEQSCLYQIQRNLIH